MIVAHFSPLQQISFMYVNSILSKDSSQRLKLTKDSLQHHSSWVTMLTLWFRSTEAHRGKKYVWQGSLYQIAHLVSTWPRNTLNRGPLSSYTLLEKWGFVLWTIYVPKNNKIGWLKYTYKNLPCVTLGDSHVF
jgi:hypothetical protein